MEFFTLIESRRSVRLYQETPIEPEKLHKILEAANIAPSAGNLQGYEIFQITRVEQRQELVKAAYGQEFLSQAPVVLVFCANPRRSSGKYGQRGRELYSIQDATISCTFAMLAAQELGLSTVWVGAFKDEPVRQAAGIPAELLPVAMLPIGYGAETPQHRPRRLLADIVHAT
jgi:nitroreductase